jgi:hypothetical protein
MVGEMHVSNEDQKTLIKAKMKINLKKKRQLNLTISKRLGIGEF